MIWTDPNGTTWAITDDGNGFAILWVWNADFNHGSGVWDEDSYLPHSRLCAEQFDIMSTSLPLRAWITK